MKAVAFRRAMAGDATCLTAIVVAGKAHWAYPQAWLELWRPDLVVTSRYIETEAVSILECNGRIAGFTGLSNAEEGRQIEHLWLEPFFIGHGLGRRLLEKALRLAREERVTQLFVNSDPNAEGFYLKMGAERIGEEVYSLPGGVRRKVPRLVFRFR